MQLDMKRIYWLIFLVFVSISLSAQDGNLKKQFYIRGGLSIPSWKYYGHSDKTEWTDTKRFGAEFELGSIFMINALKLARGMRIGINVDYTSISYHRFDVNRSNLDYLGYTNYDLYIGSKLGPSFSYSPVKFLVFDIYGKINPVWFGLTTVQPNNDVDYIGVSDKTYLGYLGIKYSVGMNIRFTALMIGFEFNPGSISLKETSFDSDTPVYKGNVNDNSDKSKIACYNFTIGASF
jgi:hypothetical protein